MGVPIGEADGNHVTLCECGSCGEQYETDETMSNACPECDGFSYDILDGTATNPDLSWRESVDA